MAWLVQYRKMFREKSRHLEMLQMLFPAKTKNQVSLLSQSDTINSNLPESERSLRERSTLHYTSSVSLHSRALRIALPH